MRLSLQTYDDVGEYSAHVAPLLLADEHRHNLMLGVINTLQAQPDVYPDRFLAAADADGEPVAAMLMTPPFNVIVSDVRVQEGANIEPVVDMLVSALLEHHPRLTGVTANRPYAELVSDAWRRRSAGRARVFRTQGVYSIERVTEPASVVGSPRGATIADRELVLDWYRAFEAEVHMDMPMHILERQLESRLRGEGGGVDLWEAGGEVVSLTGYATSTPNGARIGPVYTPERSRRRGYASALVAATTRRLLGSGRRFCFLYTDLANPTSNHIYRAIGYEQVCVAEDWRFDHTPG